MNDTALVAEEKIAFDPTKFKAGQREAWSAVAEGWATGVGRAMAQLSMPLVEFANVQPGDRVLDLATGGGTASFAAASVGAKEVIASDIAPGFRPIIEGIAKDLGFEDTVRFAEVDMESIPYEPNSFDRVICQLGIMFPPDRAVALREIFRVLRPNGVFGAATLGTADENSDVAPIITYPMSLLGPVSESAPHPFICGNKAAFIEELRAAGFVDIQAKEFPMIARNESLDEAMESWTNVAPVAGPLSKLDAKGKATVLEFIQNQLLNFRRIDGAIELKMSALLFTGKKP